MRPPSHTPLSIARATTADVDAIVTALRANANDTSLSQQPRRYVARYVSGFLVAREGDGPVLGAAQVHVHRPGYVEILSVAIYPDAQGRGVGSALVRRAIEVAWELSPRFLWLSTEKPDYFARFGFVRWSQWDLPWPILVAKLPIVFRQRPSRWWSLLTGGPIFMRLHPSRPG